LGESLLSELLVRKDVVGQLYALQWTLDDLLRLDGTRWQASAA
jgi:hypothetical protein